MAKAAKQENNVVELKRNGPSEDGVIALNLGKIQRAKAEFETANGNYRATLKHVEAKGIDLKAAKDALAIKKSGKLDEKIAYLRALTHYLLILGTPIEKEQLDLFHADLHDRDAIAKAHEGGRYVGLMGQGTDQNPYAPDSDLGQSWMNGFHEGTKERDLIMSMDSGVERIAGDADDTVFDEDDEE